MKRFFPNYISHALSLLDKYRQFISQKEYAQIGAIPHILRHISSLQAKFEKVQSIEGLTEDDQIVRNLNNFRQLLMELEELETFALPVITHYKEEFDGYLTGILRKICVEIGCPITTPHVCALSTGCINQGRDYYWYHSRYETIFVPAVEKFSLLNLPDLIHELGHHISKVYGNYFTAPFPGWFEECHVNLERELLLSNIRDPKRIEESKKVFSLRWPEWWAEEIVCDLVATYCLGHAFAWTNLKLCQHLPPYDMSPGIYDYSETHPADAYRMEAILMMLEKLGISGEEIRETWAEYAQICYPKRPVLYEYHFPNDLMEKMVSQVFQTCDSIGLIPYNHNMSKDNSVIWELNQAWQVFKDGSRCFDKIP